MEFLFQLGWKAAAVAVFFTLFDYLTGYIGAAKTNSIISGKMREGLFHKVGFWLALLLAAAFEVAAVVLKAELGAAGFEEVSSIVPYFPSLAVMSAIVIWIELVSSCENLCILVPELKNLSFMQRLKDHKPDAPDLMVGIVDEDEAATAGEGEYWTGS